MKREIDTWSFSLLAIILACLLSLNISCSNNEEEDDDVFVGTSQQGSFISVDISTTRAGKSQIVQIICMVYFKGDPVGYSSGDLKIYFRLLEKYEPVQILVSDVSNKYNDLNKPDIVNGDGTLDPAGEDVVDLADVQEGEIFCEFVTDGYPVVCKVTSSVPDSTYVIEISTNDGWTSNPITIHFPLIPDVPDF